MKRNRREFLEDVGSGMLLAGLGVSLATDLGISPAFASEGEDTLDFGEFDSLVDLMQATPPEKLQPLLVSRLQEGTADLRTLTAAAALANAETFGGEDYVGFHTEMALLPALQMAQELPSERRALPVLKVLYRNAARIQQSGKSAHKTLKPVHGVNAANLGDGESLRQATRSADLAESEQLFAAQVDRSLDDAYNALLWAVEDDIDVHRFVLAHRAFALIDVVGREHAHTMLRQCVRYCVDSEQGRIKRNRPESPIRKLVPKILDQYGLPGRPLGTRDPGDAWVAEMAKFVYEETGDKAMDAVAAALGEGISPEAVGEAISLACNQLVLAQDKLSDGSTRVHGATPGVHSSDATNSWRNMARVANERNSVVGLMVAAYHTGGYQHYKQEAFPHADHRAAIKTTAADKLLQEAEAAIRDNDQARACAAVAIYGEQGHAPRPVFDLMLRYGISEDGRLHAEKYYRTVTEEFATTRSALRWQYLLGLARVTASAYGYDADDNAGHRAPGYEEACRLLGVQA